MCVDSSRRFEYWFCMWRAMAAVVESVFRTDGGGVDPDFFRLSTSCTTHDGAVVFGSGGCKYAGEERVYV